MDAVGHKYATTNVFFCIKDMTQDLCFVSGGLHLFINQHNWLLAFYAMLQVPPPGLWDHITSRYLWNCQIVSNESIDDETDNMYLFHYLIYFFIPEVLRYKKPHLPHTKCNFVESELLMCFIFNVCVFISFSIFYLLILSIKWRRRNCISY